MSEEAQCCECDKNIEGEPWFLLCGTCIERLAAAERVIDACGPAVDGAIEQLCCCSAHYTDEQKCRYCRAERLIAKWRGADDGTV